MSNFPVDYEADYVEDRSRLTTFFRWFLLIPFWIEGIFLGIAAFFTIIATWFAVVITGRYPAGLYSFHAGLLRWGTRVNSYGNLATDAFPPFGLEDDRAYPIRLNIAPAKTEYSRLHAFFRLFTAIPAMVISYALNVVVYFVSIGVWFLVVITGQTNEALQNLLNMGLAYSAKVSAYVMLMHEEWFPPIADDPAPTASLQSGAPPADSPLSSGSSSQTPTE